ncbi:AAA family ATPase [Gordonia alkanivorans]|uniref:AAA family ATPase n=1 Tax=Gordonia alkanivorans TaxID=84096 RepID=UPI001E45B139|nr:SMC family ATPase [Gordonia alkanivorans]
MLVATLRNFRSIENLTLDFRSEGLHAVIGRPGSGKSSVFTGLLFSLYGVAGPDQDLLDLRYDKAPDGAAVVADYIWTHEGTEYRTLRELKRGTRKGRPYEKSSARMWRDGTEIDQMTPTEMTKQVTDILGMNDRSYAGSSLIRQGEVDTLTTASPAAVQQIVEDLTGIGEISKARDAARKRASEARAVAEAMPGELDTAQAAADEVAAAENDAQLVMADADKATARASRARGNWSQADDTANQLRRRATEAQRAREAVSAAQGAVTAAQESAQDADRRLVDLGVDGDTDLAELETTLQRHSADRSAAASAGNAVHYAIREVEAATADLDVARKSAAAAADSRDVLNQTVEKLATAVTAIAEEITDGEVRARSAESTAAQAMESAELLRGADATCPTCSQGIAEPGALVATLIEQHRTWTATAADARARVQQLRQRKSTKEHELTEVRGQIDQVDKLEASVAQAADRLTRALRDRAALVGECADLVGVQSDIAAEVMAAVRNYIGELDAKLGTMGEQRAALQAATTAWQQVRRATERLSVAREAAHEAPDPTAVEAAITLAAELRADADALATQASEASARAQTAQARCVQLRAAAELAARQWDQKREAVLDAEVAGTTAAALTAYRQDLIADFCAGISAGATELLERFGGEHVAFHLDSDFVPRVELADGRLRKTSSLSGGEKARVGLAFRLGISMQITANGLPSQLLGDEVTQYLDDDGRRQVVATISQLFTSPIMVSHTSEVLDHATRVHEFRRSPLGVTQVADVT